MLLAPIDLLGSRLIREFKTSELVIEIEPKDVMGEGESSGLGVGKELLVMRLSMLAPTPPPGGGEAKLGI